MNQSKIKNPAVSNFGESDMLDILFTNTRFVSLLYHVLEV